MIAARAGSRPSAYEILLLITVILVLIWSGISPHDRFTWLFEVFPVLLGIPAVLYVYPRFRFTPLVTGLESEAYA